MYAFIGWFDLDLLEIVVADAVRGAGGHVRDLHFLVDASPFLPASHLRINGEFGDQKKEKKDSSVE